MDPESLTDQSHQQVCIEGPWPLAFVDLIDQNECIFRQIPSEVLLTEAAYVLSLPSPKLFHVVDEHRLQPTLL